MVTLVRWVFVVLAMVNMMRAQTVWTEVFSGDYTEYNAKKILSIRTDLIDPEIGGPGGPGDIFFLSELTRSEFMVAFHPERGEIAIRNAKYARGESKWGFQWVDIEFPFLESYIEGDYHTYSVAFVGDKVVLTAEGRTLLEIPLIELCDDVDEYLNSIYGARFEYTYESTMLEYSIDVLPTFGDAIILDYAMSNTYCKGNGRCWPASHAIDGKWSTSAQTWNAAGTKWFEVNIDRALIHQVVLKAGAWSGSGIKVLLYSKGRKVGKCPVKKGYGRKNGVTLDCDRVEADKVKVTVSTKKGKLTVYEIKVKTIAL